MSFVILRGRFTLIYRKYSIPFLSKIISYICHFCKFVTLSIPLSLSHKNTLLLSFTLLLSVSLSISLNHTHTHTHTPSFFFDCYGLLFSVLPSLSYLLVFFRFFSVSHSIKLSLSLSLSLCVYPIERILVDKNPYVLNSPTEGVPITYWLTS